MSFPKDISKSVELARDELDFSYLPAYAGFILANHAENFALEMLRSSREMEIPLLKFFESIPEETLIYMSVEGGKELLGYFAQNDAQGFIELSLRRWLENQVPIIQSDEVAVKDIVAIGFIRRKAFRKFLPLYNVDIDVALQLLDELDRFIVSLEEICYARLFQLKQQKINDHLYFIEKINNTLPGGIYVFDVLEQKEIYTNQRREELLGFAETEIKEMGGRMLGSLLHQDDVPNVLDHLKKFSSAADGEMRSVEYRLRNKKGKYHWLRGHETPFKRTPEGKISQIIGISLDITAEKDTKFQLDYREQQLSQAEEIAGLGSFEWDILDGNSVFSKQLMKIFELEGKSNMTDFMAFVHPYDRQKLTQAIDDALKGTKIYECEYRYKKSADEKIIWSKGVVTFANGKPVKMKGTVMDVTQRHDMLKRLERSVELYQQAQELTHIGNWTWHISENKITWSDEMYRIYGLFPQSEEITFERFLAFVHPADRETRLEEIQRALKTNQADDYEMRIVLVDGSIKILQGKGEVLVDTDGKPYKLVGTCQDVTEQVLLNQQLKVKNTELEHSNQELASFNYIASHDLQEPLRKIRMYSNLLVEKYADFASSGAKVYLDRVVTSATIMQKLINDLLTFSRTTSVEKIFEPVDLNELIEEVKGLLHEQIDKRTVTIEYTPLPTLHIIHFQFQQLLENILSNAIKYSKPDVVPTIRITSDIVAGKFINEQAVPEKKYRMVSISDNGIGFDQRYADKIFEVFQRLHDKNEYSGTGIGLAICKKIMQNHNGFITAQSKVGEGSVFNVFVPVTD